MLYLLLLLSIVFIVYELLLHRYYKKDLENEKLIASFSNARMQLMKMLYMQEINKDSCYFNFMIRATSYSIRTIYYRKNKLTLEQLNCLETMLKFIIADDLKNEFKALNSEQKELFVKTVINILSLYFNNGFVYKLVWTICILELGSNILKGILKLLEKLLDAKSKKKIEYINDINNSYNLSQYACA